MSSSEMDNSGDQNSNADGWATWVGLSLASAFFASLERFSCVNLDTSYSDDEEDEEAHDRPLMLTTFKHSMDSRNSADDLPV
ncbi:uncharacterized protein LOC124931036 [Impatiens glandulifera]|uniref:uncharacterized protein LOC124931036 n=1 Tax=Impatiens glandulifera TaxID=253017 RepID=UPI001FB1127A|nr:uncharacterized protein LOC124931036 [Impatiens glandulifera]